ncbi:MAG: bacterial proteasome activator family protein [Acidimicrobiales bacterium]|nr:bacterial proteasome activator family protein [Acidimicrobiales bacterium]
MTDTTPPAPGSSADGSPAPNEPGADGPSPDPTVQGELVDEAIGEDDDRREAIEEPAKLMRIGSMIKGLLEEVRTADLDDAARVRLREIYETSLAELGSSLSDDLLEELKRVTSPFAESAESAEPPSDAELRIAQAQLVGWLEGLFHGIQASLFAQQMAARAQLEQLHRQLPSGGAPGAAGPAGPGGPPRPGGLGEPGPGTYL